MGHLYQAILLLLAGSIAVAQSAASSEPAQSASSSQKTQSASSSQKTRTERSEVSPKHVCTDLGQTEIVPCPGEGVPAAPAAPIAPGTTAAVPPSTNQVTVEPTLSPSSPEPKNVPASRDSEVAHLRAEAPPDVNLAAVPSSTVYHAALRDLPLNLLQDQRNFYTSPLRTRATDLNLLVPFAGVTAILAVGVDRGIESHLPTSPGLISRSISTSNYGAAAMAGGVGGAWLLGQIRHDDHMSEAGFLSGEAAISTLAIAELGKYAFARQRPLVGDGKGSFLGGGDSFPSLHAAAAFSIATVMTEEYPSPLIKLLSYGAASGIAAARVTGRQHFMSDVLVGAGLGWFMGRQVYRAHHDNDGDLNRWGDFERASGDRPRDPSSMGSPYVPMDSWVYAAFDRLVGLGYVRGAFVGLRPWTRMQCAAFVDEARDNGVEDSPPNSLGDDVYQALAVEFAPELRRRSGSANLGASVDSVYARATDISSLPLTDGYHFGQTIIDDFGRPFQKGTNAIAGVSASAVAGPFAVHIRGEYQYAPSGQALPLSARQAIAAADTGLPVSPALPQASTSRFMPVEAYASINLQDWQISFGTQSLWWGPDNSGPMLFSDNAAPIPMLRVSRVAPIKLPGILSLLGEVRAESFLGRLQGQQLIFSSQTGLFGQYGGSLHDQPFISGQKLSFKFTQNTEFGISRTVLMGGAGVPFTSHTVLRGLLGTGNGAPGSVADEGDERSGLDFSYRLPKLRNWLTFYADGFTDDEFSPIAYWDRAAWTAGLYLSHVPRVPKLDLRAEGVYTDLPIGGAVARGFFYFNDRFVNGYTSNGYLLGSWIGRQSQGAQAWSTYHFSPRSYLQLGLRHQKSSAQFIAGGGTLTDVSLASEFWAKSNLQVGAGIQYENWTFPVLGAPRTPIVTSISVAYYPSKRAK